MSCKSCSSSAFTGVSHYENLTLTPQLLHALRKPVYCPPDDSPPIFKPVFSDLDKLCLKQWV